MSKKRIKPNYRRRLLRLPDLDHCKRAVLNSLGSPASRRGYEFAIDQFIAWYCSEPRRALTASWSSVIACILNQEVWPQVRECSKSHKPVGCSILPAMSFALRGRNGKRTPLGVSPPSKCEVLSTLRYRTMVAVGGVFPLNGDPSPTPGTCHASTGCDRPRASYKAHTHRSPLTSKSHARSKSVGTYF